MIADLNLWQNTLEVDRIEAIKGHDKIYTDGASFTDKDGTKVGAAIISMDEDTNEIKEKTHITFPDRYGAHKCSTQIAESIALIRAFGGVNCRPPVISDSLYAINNFTRGRTRLVPQCNKGHNLDNKKEPGLSTCNKCAIKHIKLGLICIECDFYICHNCVNKIYGDEYTLRKTFKHKNITIIERINKLTKHLLNTSEDYADEWKRETCRMNFNDKESQRMIHGATYGGRQLIKIKSHQIEALRNNLITHVRPTYLMGLGNFLADREAKIAASNKKGNQIKNIVIPLTNIKILVAYKGNVILEDPAKFAKKIGARSFREEWGNKSKLMGKVSHLEDIDKTWLDPTSWKEFYKLTIFKNHDKLEDLSHTAFRVRQAMNGSWTSFLHYHNPETISDLTMIEEGIICESCPFCKTTRGSLRHYFYGCTNHQELNNMRNTCLTELEKWFELTLTPEWETDIERERGEIDFAEPDKIKYKTLNKLGYALRRTNEEEIMSNHKLEKASDMAHRAIIPSYINKRLSNIKIEGLEQTNEFEFIRNMQSFKKEEWRKIYSWVIQNILLQFQFSARLELHNAFVKLTEKPEPIIAPIPEEIETDITYPCIGKYCTNKRINKIHGAKQMEREGIKCLTCIFLDQKFKCAEGIQNRYTISKVFREWILEEIRDLKDLTKKIGDKIKISINHKNSRETMMFAGLPYKDEGRIKLPMTEEQLIKTCKCTNENLARHNICKNCLGRKLIQTIPQQQNCVTCKEKSENLILCTMCKEGFHKECSKSWYPGLHKKDCKKWVCNGCIPKLASTWHFWDRRNGVSKLRSLQQQEVLGDFVAAEGNYPGSREDIRRQIINETDRNLDTTTQKEERLNRILVCLGRKSTKTWNAIVKRIRYTKWKTNKEKILRIKIGIWADEIAAELKDVAKHEILELINCMTTIALETSKESMIWDITHWRNSS